MLRYFPQPLHARIFQCYSGVQAFGDSVGNQCNPLLVELVDQGLFLGNKLVDLLGLLQGTGMSLDQTLQVIGSDFGNVMPVLSQEIQLANLQYSRGSTRERSFGRMSEIYQNENLLNLTGLMIQIDKYGGAVQEPLRVFGERLREQRKAKMKELIGKISVKMTGVMVVTLLPALIIITAGPGFLAVIRALGAMTK